MQHGANDGNCRILSKRRGLFVSLLLTLTLAACTGIERRPALPPLRQHPASILGLPNERFYSDEGEAMSLEMAQGMVREAKALGIRKGGVLPTVHALSLSGGSDNGAFGAGLLVGWTAHHDRPKFKLVTGVSTGALIAPFAFLGPEYDPMLTQVYTEIDPGKVFEKRLPIAAVTGDALADTSPLYQTISQHVTESLLQRIGEEYQKGRFLMIQTTDLDAGRPVFWNIGAIAASGRPEAIDLVRHILLASAAIPAAFPPVMFDVIEDGQHYQEMHVDGGAVSQAFVQPLSVDTWAAWRTAGYSAKGYVQYVIRNARLRTDWTDVQRSTLPIAQKAVSVMINYNGIGDLYKMYLLTKREGGKLNLAYITDEFDAPHKEEFDPTYMQALYDFAYKKASDGYPWVHTPPGMVVGKDKTAER